ncbi:hypothetical protein JCM8097_000744 [Rhodosporidiobolus ruineniae]
MLDPRTGISAHLSFSHGPPAAPNDPSAPLPSLDSLLSPSSASSTLLEYAPTYLGETHEHIAYVEASPSAAGAPIRVGFKREQGVREVQGTEGYAAFVQVGNGQTWCKVYATGAGVEKGHFPWFIDCSLGGFCPGPKEAITAQRITLRISPVLLKPDVHLGTGHLLVKDIEKIEDVAVQFCWIYLTRSHLDLLGVLEDQPSQSWLRSETAAALSFLRTSNRLLTALLTPEQRVSFVDQLSADEEAMQDLPQAAKDELRRFGAGGMGGAAAGFDGVVGGQDRGGTPVEKVKRVQFRENEDGGMDSFEVEEEAVVHQYGTRSRASTGASEELETVPEELVRE